MGQNAPNCVEQMGTTNSFSIHVKPSFSWKTMANEWSLTNTRNAISEFYYSAKLPIYKIFADQSSLIFIRQNCLFQLPLTQMKYSKFPSYHFSLSTI
jgi:hypothetical protein